MTCIIMRGGGGGGWGGGVPSTRLELEKSATLDDYMEQVNSTGCKANS